VAGRDQSLECAVCAARLEDARDTIRAPISASIRIASAYAELQSQLGAHWFSALNARYDDNGRFGGKVTYRIAPTW